MAYPATASLGSRDLRKADYAGQPEKDCGDMADVMIRPVDLEAARASTVALLERIRADLRLMPRRATFVEVTENTLRSSLHDLRAARRIEIALAEVDAALKHLRRALNAGPTDGGPF
jgi:hypothetical protein